jgi:hypothetical protein
MPLHQVRREMALELAAHQPPLDLRDEGICYETLIRLDWPVRVLMWCGADAMKIARQIRDIQEGNDGRS